MSKANFLRYPIKIEGVLSCSTSIENTCPLLKFRKFGLVPVCAATGHDLHRNGADGLGYITIDNACPLKEEI